MLSHPSRCHSSLHSCDEILAGGAARRDGGVRRWRERRTDAGAGSQRQGRTEGHRDRRRVRGDVRLDAAPPRAGPSSRSIPTIRAASSRTDAEEIARHGARRTSDTNAKYPRTPDHYILIRSQGSARKVVQTNAAVLARRARRRVGPRHPPDATSIRRTRCRRSGPSSRSPARSTRSRGTRARSICRSIDDPTIEVVRPRRRRSPAPARRARSIRPCNARLVCDRASMTCGRRRARSTGPIRGATSTAPATPTPIARSARSAIRRTRSPAPVRTPRDYFTTRRTSVATCASLAPMRAPSPSQCPRIYIDARCRRRRGSSPARRSACARRC